ncbi:MAG TPA: methyltransferase domain-containing protein [Stellaceae bacterium]|nr:methyltransferase domain-containing protein [Stellaceae bacterium]
MPAKFLPDLDLTQRMPELNPPNPPSIDTIPLDRCWCGSDSFQPFNDDYRICERCGTLLCRFKPSEGDLGGSDDGDLYSKEYWLAHQTEGLHQPTVVERARSDLSERCLYWLRTLLKYKQPPARVLEIGCAHGGFVATMKAAGFDAEGVELSPWVIDFAKRTFDINVLQGPLDTSSVAPGSLDVIALFDVLEHLTDPSVAINEYRQLLKPDGILLIQTPCWRPNQTYEEMLSNKAPFLHQLMPLEHLFLFTEASVVEFLTGCGFAHIAFEPALFSIYDMFLIASPAQLRPAETEAIERAVNDAASTKLIIPMLDLYAREEALSKERLMLLDQHFETVKVMTKLEADAKNIIDAFFAKDNELRLKDEELRLKEVELQARYEDARARDLQLRSKDEELRSKQQVISEVNRVNEELTVNLQEALHPTPKKVVTMGKHVIKYGILSRLRMVRAKISWRRHL